MRVAGWFAGMLALPFALGLAGCAVDEAAPPPPPPKTIAELDAQLAKFFKDGHVPGAQVALVENGQIVWLKSYGVSDVAANTPVTDDTVFRAGSISKSVTGIAVMTLVEQGKLSLDGKLTDLAPEVKFENEWEATDPVRLVNLIEHTTGWPDIGPRILQLDAKGWTTLQGVQDASPLFVSRWKPGYFSVYNNAGPAVAGVIIEKASGRTFGAYVNERVMRPMGMATADFDLTPALAARIGKSYAADGSVTPYQYISLPPAGSLNITARELAQLVRFFVGRGTVDGHTILSPESVARIERAESNLGARHGFTNGYALGNAPFPDKGITFRGHNGEIDAFTAVMGYTTRNNSGYVMMANGGEGVNFGTPASAAIQAYLTRDVPMTPPPNATVSDEELARYAGVYRNISPANDLSRPFQEVIGLIQEILGVSSVSAGHGKLAIGGNDWVPVGDGHSFRRTDREAPGLAFFEDNGTIYKVSPFYTAVQVPTWGVILIAAVLILVVLGLIIAIPMLPVWIVLWFRGRLKNRGGLFMRVAPFLSILTMLATFGLVLAAIAGAGTSAWHALGDVGAYSLAIMVCSILFPLFAVTGMVLALIKSNAGWFARIYTGLTSAALIVCAVYAASIGWFAIRTWTM